MKWKDSKGKSPSNKNVKNKKSHRCPFPRILYILLYFLFFFIMGWVGWCLLVAAHCAGNLPWHRIAHYAQPNTLPPPPHTAQNLVREMPFDRFMDFHNLLKPFILRSCSSEKLTDWHRRLAYKEFWKYDLYGGEKAPLSAYSQTLISVRLNALGPL